MVTAHIRHGLLVRGGAKTEDEASLAMPKGLHIPTMADERCHSVAASGDPMTIRFCARAKMKTSIAVLGMQSGIVSDK